MTELWVKPPRQWHRQTRPSPNARDIGNRNRPRENKAAVWRRRHWRQPHGTRECANSRQTPVLADPATLNREPRVTLFSLGTRAAARKP
eukprot:7302536-Pyramimonas_sp.AAC.1